MKHRRTVLCLILALTVLVSAAQAAEPEARVHRAVMGEGASSAEAEVSTGGDALLLAALYDGGSGAAVGFGKAEVSGPASGRSVSLPLTAVRPAGARAKVFLVDAGSWAPLCPSALAAAEEETAAGDFLVRGGVPGWDFEFEDGVLRILTGRPLAIRNLAPEGTSGNRIETRPGVNADVTLDGVRVAASEAAFRAAGGGHVVLTLAEGSENSLHGGGGCAGVQQDGDGTLLIRGSGALKAMGGEDAAGIGGGEGSGGGTIEIAGGVIDAKGGMSASGIGGGREGSGTEVLISGGEITALCTGGTGIGGGYLCRDVSVTVTGGIVLADGSDAFGTGIGASDDGTDTRVSVSGGTVTAIGGEGYTGIGGGHDCDNTSVTISGGTVTAYCRKNGAAIGCGGEATYGSRGTSVTISGGTVTAGCRPRTHSVRGGGLEFGDYYLGNQTAGLGAWSRDSRIRDVSVTITGGTVTAVGSDGDAVQCDDFAVQGGVTVMEHWQRPEGSSLLASVRQTGNPEGWADPSWRGVVFRNGEGLICGGAVTLEEDAAVPAGCSLTIEEGQALTVAPGKRLRADGTLVNRGRLEGEVIEAWGSVLLDHTFMTPVVDADMSLYYRTEDLKTGVLTARTGPDGSFSFRLPEDAETFERLEYSGGDGAGTLDLTGYSPREKPQFAELYLTRRGMIEL